MFCPLKYWGIVGLAEVSEGPSCTARQLASSASLVLVALVGAELRVAGEALWVGVSISSLGLGSV